MCFVEDNQIQRGASSIFFTRVARLRVSMLAISRLCFAKHLIAIGYVSFGTEHFEIKIEGIVQLSTPVVY